MDMKSAVVTGAGAGIGRAIAETLATGGWRVFGVELDPVLAADAAAELGDISSVVVGDASDRDVLGEACARASRAAPLRAWVNNAGAIQHGSVHETTEVELRRVVEVNILGVFWGCATAVREYLANGSSGAIVNLSSIHGRRSFPGWAAYDMSKGAIDALTRQVAVEYGPHGIRCNAVAPGAIRTPAQEREFAMADDPDALSDLLTKTPPLRRVGEPFEVASVTSFLLGEGAAYLTGESIAVDGGWSAG